jgi:hypothetical protein
MSLENMRHGFLTAQCGTGTPNGASALTQVKVGPFPSQYVWAQASVSAWTFIASSSPTGSINDGTGVVAMIASYEKSDGTVVNFPADDVRMSVVHDHDVVSVTFQLIVNSTLLFQAWGVGVVYLFG